MGEAKAYWEPEDTRSLIGSGDHASMTLSIVNSNGRYVVEVDISLYQDEDNTPVLDASLRVADLELQRVPDLSEGAVISGMYYAPKVVIQQKLEVQTIPGNWFENNNQEVDIFREEDP